jgi:hypothetical protein
MASSLSVSASSVLAQQRLPGGRSLVGHRAQTVLLLVQGWPGRVGRILGHSPSGRAALAESSKIP